VTPSFIWWGFLFICTMRIFGRNKKGKKVLITIPDVDQPLFYNEAFNAQAPSKSSLSTAIAVAAAAGAGGGEGSVSGSSASPSPSPSPGVDTLRQQMTSSLVAYDAATDGNWVKITKTEYDKIAANVVGATKKGNSDAQVNTRASYTSYTDWMSFGASGVPTFQINSGEYVIALISEAWNQNTGQTTLGYTTTFNGNTITQIGGNTAGTSIGGNRDYYVLKKPSTAATETRYPVMKMTVSPNAVNGWNGYRSTNNGASWTAVLNTQVSKIQIITTSTKGW